MKKLFALLLCLFMLTTLLVACGPDPDDGNGDDTTTSEGGGNGGGNSQSATTDKKLDRIFGMMASTICESVLDEKGRLVSIYTLNEMLDHYEDSPTPSEPYFAFTYGDDGKLTEVSMMGHTIPVTYVDGEPTIASQEGTLTITYHANGSIHEFLAQDAAGYTFDSMGRFTRIAVTMRSSSGVPDDGSAPIVTTSLQEYVTTYENGKATAVFKQDGEVRNDRSAVMEYNEAGYPRKFTIVNKDMDGEIERSSTSVSAWNWDADKLLSYSDTQTYVNGDESATYTSAVTCTYDDAGRRTRLDRTVDGEPSGYQLLTYTEKGQLLSQKTYDNEDVLETSVTYSYDENGTLTGYEEMDNYGENVWGYDAEGTLLRATERYNQDDGGYYIVKTRYHYDVPTVAFYDEIRYEKSATYDADGKLVHADEYEKVIFYAYSHDNGEIDEETGESLWRDGSLTCDTYGNCIDPETEEIYYFQKYLDTDGSMFYFTGEGVKVTITTYPAPAN